MRFKRRFQNESRREINDGIMEVLDEKRKAAAAKRADERTLQLAAQLPIGFLSIERSSILRAKKKRTELHPS